MSESKGSAQDRLEVSGGGRSIEKTFGSFSLCPSLVRVRNVSCGEKPIKIVRSKTKEFEFRVFRQRDDLTKKEANGKKLNYAIDVLRVVIDLAPSPRHKQPQTRTTPSPTTREVTIFSTCSFPSPTSAK